MDFKNYTRNILKTIPEGRGEFENEFPVRRPYNINKIGGGKNSGILHPPPLTTYKANRASKPQQGTQKK
jgi:hypothetical protein